MKKEGLYSTPQTRASGALSRLMYGGYLKTMTTKLQQRSRVSDISRKAITALGSSQSNFQSYQKGKRGGLYRPTKAGMKVYKKK